MKLESYKAWNALKELSDNVAKDSLSGYFKNDVSRFSKYSIKEGTFLFDYSKQLISDDCKRLLIDLANESKVKEKIQDLFSGVKINRTEDREAGHVKLRTLKANEDVRLVLDKMQHFVNDVFSGHLQNSKHEPITDVISLGIGGSALGPQLVNECLQNYDKKRVKVHYISNVDFDTLNRTLKSIPIKNTICIVSSKSFSTIETMTNADTVRDKFVSVMGEEQAIKMMFAVTASPEKAKMMGYAEENIFELWDWVGGRYSLWSAVGLPIALSIGMENFKELLLGAYEADQHLLNADFFNNIPVMMALVGIWNSNFLGCDTAAVIPYYDGLAKLPSYLQQLEMESNGKSTSYEHGFVSYKTCPVVWGGVGCDGQHAYMQMLHQGSQVVPVDFVVPVNSTESAQDKIRLASALAQAKALMDGTPRTESNAPCDIAKFCQGNKPSSMFLFDEMTPRNLGKLIAFYEHKVFVQGVIWQIESFDQWGVELGKKLATKLLPIFDNGKHMDDLDGSTAGLIDYMLSSK